MKTITKHCIEAAFIESHGRVLIDSVRPIEGKTIARVSLGDELRRPGS